MLKNTANFMLFVLLGAVLFVTSCKKDPFSEKDALQAQKELLAQKFGYDLAIANVSLQIQRAGDSARIAIQNLVNSGATALERERLASSLALKLADYNHLLNQLRYQDSLSRINTYVNSVGGVRSYQIRVIDFVTKAPINNATVKVLPWGSANFVSVRTNSDGIAIMTNVIIDPSAIFYATDENTGVTSLTTMMRRSAIDVSPTMEVYRSLAGAGSQTIAGTCSAATDLTTQSGNVGAGVLVQFTTTNNPSAAAGIAAPSTSWVVSGLTNTSGRYSVTVPRGYSWTVATSTVSLMQKMYVNYLDGIDNQFTSVTRIDSQLVTFSTGSTATRVPPVAHGYYLKLPADSLTGTNVHLRDRTTANFMNVLFNTGGVRRDIRSADGKRVDTLGTKISVAAGAFAINNDWFTGVGSHNYAVRLNDAGARVPDTLAVEVVNLTSNGIIISMPEFVAITNTDGTLRTIEPKMATATTLVNGGRFNLHAYASIDWGLNIDLTPVNWLTQVVLPSFSNYRNFTRTTLPSLTNPLSPSATTTLSTTFNINFGVTTAYVGR